MDRATECVRCGAPKRSIHFNTKYCEECRQHFLRKPKSSLSAEQIELAKSLIGKMPREEIADKLGCSVPNLKRAFRGVRLAYHNKWSINPALVAEITAYYEEHGKRKTKERYPGVSIRSIIEHYPRKKARQGRWTERELIEAARMGGIIGFDSQAAFFNRPNANAGSIRSLWMKRFGFGGGSVHGLSHWIGRHIVRPDCPYIESEFWETRRKMQRFGRKLFLWVDIEGHLKADLPAFITEAISTLANFQRWLFAPNDPKSEILRLIKERKLLS